MAGQAEALTGGSVREAVKLATGLQEAAGEVFGKLEGEASEAADQFMVGAQRRGKGCWVHGHRIAEQLACSAALLAYVQVQVCWTTQTPCRSSGVPVLPRQACPPGSTGYVHGSAARFHQELQAVSSQLCRA